MATITLKGNPIHTVGELPKIGTKAPFFQLTNTDLKDVTLDDYKKSKIILNIFPSIDTGVCATSVRQFNKKASELENTKILCISRDLPFAHARFCGAEGLNNVVSLSDFKKGNFGENYKCTIQDGPLTGLLSRAIVVIDEDGTVIYTEQVSEITQEPDYKKALKVI